MALRGSAFLPIWHDIDQGQERDYELWHSNEHLPERVLTPGIVVGRRYASLSATKHRYFLLYEAMSFDVFSSEGYFATANARSPWTQRIDPLFKNFVRAPCHLVMTRGRGIGGALTTIRVHFANPQGDQGEQALSPKDAFNLSVRQFVEATLAMDLVTAVHAGVTAPIERRPLSKNSLSLRPGATAFDGVFMIEAASRQALTNCIPKMDSLLRSQSQAIASYEVETYEISQYLASSESPQ